MARRKSRSEWAKKYLDPRWQKRRLEILLRDKWTCQGCQDTETTLHVHHRWYVGDSPWDAPDDALVTLCEVCHETETKERGRAMEEVTELFRRNLLALDILSFVHHLRVAFERYDPPLVTWALSVILSNPEQITKSLKEISGEAERE